MADFNPQSPGIYITEINASQVVPRVATTIGALAGIFNWGPVFEPTVVDSSNSYIRYFGKPDANNYETWFTGRNFLDYANTLYVVRTVETSNGTNLANVALTATGGNNVTNNDILLVTAASYNDATYQGLKDSGQQVPSVYFSGRYPGAKGNALRIGTCYSKQQWSSSVVLGGTISTGPSAGNTYTGALLLTPGSRSAKFVFTPTAGSNVAAANLYANTLVPTRFSVGDYLQVSTGGRIRGSQNVQIYAITNAATNSTAAHVSFTLATPYAGGSNLTQNTVLRFWEYAALCPAPTNNWISSYQANSSAPNVPDLVNIIVIDNNGQITGVPNTVLETYQGLSRATDAKDKDGNPIYWKDIINHNSSWIRAFTDLPGVASNTANFLTVGSPGGAPFNINLSGGTDTWTETTAPMQILINGWELFQGAENIKINLVMAGKSVGGDPSGIPAGVIGQLYYNQGMADWLINNIAINRGDCVVFFSPDKSIVVNASTGSDIPTDLINWASTITPSDRAFLDGNYKYQYDEFNNTWRWVPFNGDIAGLCVNTDRVTAPWFSPAGFNRGNIRNVTRLAWNPQQGDRDVIYPNAINPIVQFPGLGVVLFGDRTFTLEPSAFDRINVRRLFLFMEQSIKIYARYTLFELNDVFTQNAFKNAVTPFLKSIQAGRGITDFQVICDSTVNTPDVINANQFVADILVKPERSINFINIQFFAVPDGVAFNTVSLT